jgi:hypothetical protein
MGKIVAVLLGFIALLLFPIWFSALFGGTGAKPQIVLPKTEKKCVANTEYMRHWHMDLLNNWRDEVVREGKRIYISEDGSKYEMSLTLTCLRCHDNKAKFCDQCHNYVGVDPYCWDCHVAPEGN